jgi:vancomycin permeability regulator SanA
MNPLYQQMTPNNNLLQRFQQFKQNFTGNPQEQVQQLLNSGKVSQQQYDSAVRMANQLKQMMGM